MNGGVSKAELGQENVNAVVSGCANLGRHLENLKSFGVPVIVGINHFVTDTSAEIQAIKSFVEKEGSEAILCKHWASGSKGTIELATRVAEIADSDISNFSPLYEDELSLFEKIESVAKNILASGLARSRSAIRGMKNLLWHL